MRKIQKQLRFDTTGREYISEIEIESQAVLPRRGTIHDMGPSQSDR